VFIALSVPASAEASFERLLLGQNGVTMVRVLLCLKYYKLWGVAFWNLVYLMASVYACEACIADPSNKSLFLVHEGFFFVFVIMLATWSREGVRAEARLEAQKAMLHGERLGFRDLMEIVCDVVVNLDEKMRFTEAASRLSAMVKFRGEISLLGMSLKDFMPDEADKQGFEDCIAAMSGPYGEADSTKPRMMHVKLRDSLGNLINVELFCATIRTILGTSYMVGIREFSDGLAALAECKHFERGRSRAVSKAKGSGALLRQSSHSHSDGDHSEPWSDEESKSVSSEISARTPHFFPTTSMGVEFALTNVMARMAVESGQRPSECCSYHTRLRLLQEAVERMQALGCISTFGSEERVQCRSCGFLNRDGRSGLSGRPRTPRDAVCFACEDVLETWPTRTSPPAKEAL